MERHNRVYTFSSNHTYRPMSVRVVAQLFYKIKLDGHVFYFLDITVMSFFSLNETFLKFSEDSHIKRTVFYGLVPRNSRNSRSEPNEA